MRFCPRVSLYISHHNWSFRYPISAVPTAVLFSSLETVIQYTLTFDSVFSPYCSFNLEQISDGLQPSFVRNLITMRCSKLTCNFASLIFLTADATAQWQTPGWRMILEQCCLLPHITVFSGPRCIFDLRTNYNPYLPEPCTY